MLQDAGDSSLGWSLVLRGNMGSAWLWIPPSILALWVVDRWPLERDAWPRRLGVYAVASAAVCLFRAVAVVLLNEWMVWYTELPGFGEIMITSIINNLLLFWMLLAVGHALVYARRYRERDEQLARAQLNALRMQLHPHFLFNALNTVNAYVRTDPDTAERMIARLGQLLRHALAGGGAHEVALEEELQIARAYLDIEQVRFEDRLRVRWNVDPSTHAARVPSLLLQPLVENAVRHGIAPRAAPGTIEIAAERMIARLSTLLRHALDGGSAQEVALEEELRIARTYLEIEQVRFEDRLRVEWRVDPETYGAKVPHLLLQPLVENAIRHGIAPRAAEGTIEIVAERRNGTLHLAVRDDGAGMRSGDVREGVGLANTRTRLRQLYGSRQRLEVRDAPGGGVHVEVELPFTVDRP